MKLPFCPRLWGSCRLLVSPLAVMLCLCAGMAAGCVGIESRPMVSPASVVTASPTPGSVPSPTPATERLILRPILPAGRELLEADKKAIADILLWRSGCLADLFWVEWEGEGRIAVELTGVHDPSMIVRTLLAPGQLEFVEVRPDDLQPSDWELGFYVRTGTNRDGPDPATYGTVRDPFPDQVFETILSGRHVKEASVTLTPDRKASIMVEFTDEGKRILADYTAQHVGGVLGIVLDNIVLMAPRIDEPITEGNAQLNGTWTVEEADCLAARMSGALPFPLQVVERSGGIPE
jgi:hypothetical protein